VAVDDLGEHVGEVAERLDVVQLAHLDQRSDDGPVLGAAFRAGEEGVLRLSAIGRIDRSTVLEPISMPPYRLRSSAPAPEAARQPLADRL